MTNIQEQLKFSYVIQYANETRLDRATLTNPVAYSLLKDFSYSTDICEGLRFELKMASGIQLIS